MLQNLSWQRLRSKLKGPGPEKMKNEKSTDLYHLGFNVSEAFGHF